MNMNNYRDQLKRQIAVMQAYLDGKDVRFRKGGMDKWEIANSSRRASLVFDWSEWEYEVVPERMERWAIVHSETGCMSSCCKTKDMAECDLKQHSLPERWRIVHLREVSE